MLIQTAFSSFLFASLCAAFIPSRFMAKPPNFSQYDYETRYFDVLLDHFTFVSDLTFKMKYLISTKFHVPDGPILFYTGNEGAIETFAENTGFMWDIAEELKAAVLFAEHRFYGSSLPFVNDSFKDPQHFGYLTAEQALADYASLIQYLKSSVKNFENSPVIAFGGSYGGMLSAWFRYKYPNLIAGAVAASAPIWLFPNMSNCAGFYDTATRAFSTSGSTVCTKNVALVWDSIRTVAKQHSGHELLRLMFQLCDPLPDEQKLIDYLIDFLGTLAMVNYPYEASFIGTFPPEPVKYFCKGLSDAVDKNVDVDIVQRVATAVRSLTNYTKNQSCISLEGDLPGLDAKAWTLQTCLEMTTPMCSNGDGMFPPLEWDPVVFCQSCFDKFAVRPRLNWSAVEFWGKNIKTATNIVFSNGDLDPWSAFGVLTDDQAPGCNVIRIPSGAHHLDLRAKNELDPPDVVDARQRELQHIKDWIDEWHAKPKNLPRNQMNVDVLYYSKLRNDAKFF
ncbi:hypothetical protein CRM22_002534 [Opisthorchis felineus]|uniref:Lysosomal Pro-X carboxypeptidase n=2 Tax=Opisthorchis felineus TaxID=147828 RepID=A0A4S2M5I7_OPIFE|nr:hypothetical protein CRM22_002534 [Opisthorchis felineus]